MPWIGSPLNLKIKYNTINKKILTAILDFCKKHQKGRVNEKLTQVNFNFNERWFRDSSLYDLTKENQLSVLKWFIEIKKGKVSIFFYFSMIIPVLEFANSSKFFFFGVKK